MNVDEPDIATLFAPADIRTAVLGVLPEAEAALGNITDPVDAELWGSDIIGALATAAHDEAAAMAALAEELVPAVEESGTDLKQAILRILGVLGNGDLRAAAAEAARHLDHLGVSEPSWAAGLGAPAVSACWHYADVGGRQESVTMTFAYGDYEHAISVLIDHTQGGKMKDAWLTQGKDQFLAAEIAASGDPLVVFEPLEPPEAADRIRHALRAGEAPSRPEAAEGISAHRALIRTRLALFRSAAY
jgi:hypothetical protein